MKLRDNEVRDIVCRGQVIAVNKHRREAAERNVLMSC